VIGFVAVEGIDGAGKSTFADRLAVELRRRDQLPVQLTEPSHGRFGQRVRQLLAEGVAITDERLGELFLADRRDHTARRTRPLLAVARERPDLGIVLVQDRSYYSSQAYQGLDAEAAQADIERYEKVAVRPDLVLLLDVPLDVAAARIAGRQGLADGTASGPASPRRRQGLADGTASGPASPRRRPAAEQDVTSLDVLGRARAVYLDLAARLPHFTVLDGMRPATELAAEVAERYWPPR
jgi:dTMP kinase